MAHSEIFQLYFKQNKCKEQNVSENVIESCLKTILEIVNFLF